MLVKRLLQTIIYFGRSVRQSTVKENRKLCQVWLDGYRNNTWKFRSLHLLCRFDYDGKRKYPRHQGTRTSPERPIVPWWRWMLRSCWLCRYRRPKLRNCLGLPKHLEVPVFTFMNKLDRDGREPLDLLQNWKSLGHHLKCPMNWPIGMGKPLKDLWPL